MCAICGSLGFAPCAEAVPVASSKAASAAKILATGMTSSIFLGRKNFSLRIGWCYRLKVPGFFGIEAQSGEHVLGHLLAAAPGEREGSGENRANLLLEGEPQKPAGPVQPRLHGFGAQIEGRRGFLHAHLLDHAADEHGAEILRQLVYRAFEHLPDL